MNETFQIRENLISKINQTEDLEFLKAIHAIFERAETLVHQLNNLQKESIKKGEEDFESGKFESNETVFKEIREWLEKK